MLIKAIITDFDGTLVDTYLANMCAYKAAFYVCGFELSDETYKACFGLRFNDFMNKVGIVDIDTQNKIKELKAELYPEFFHLLIPNTTLIDSLTVMKKSGIKIAIASTARRENLLNVLQHFELTDIFDTILTGESVKCGKPDPEIYILTMEQLGVQPNEVLIYEDSDVGLQAAQDSGANYIKVTKNWFSHEN
jgi:HAD superfamily hydrolase (TIGR01509 family)